MQYPGVIKVTVIRETTAMATAPAQLVPVRAAVAEHAGHHEPEPGDDVDVAPDAAPDEV
jgi:hypothetical protein